MDKNNIVLLRILAFFIDFSVIMTIIVAINKLGIYLGIFSGSFAVEVLMFVCIPLGFFIYWLGDINFGKRLFRLKVVDATTGNKPKALSYFKRCLLFSLVISFNVLFLIAPFVSKRGRALHDMLANTLVIKKV